MGLIDNIVKRFLEQGIIQDKIKLSKNAYHIKIQSESIKSVDFVPGYFVRLGVGFDNHQASMKDKVRSYSVWDIDKTFGTIDLAIATQSNGIGSQWVKNCKVGDSISFVWKTGNFLLNPSADSYLMIGDLSALSHLYIINRHLNKPVESIIYSQSKDELFADLDAKYPLSFYEFPENPSGLIIEKMSKILPKMRGKKMVYVAGDSRVCVAVNQFLKHECSMEPKQIMVKPFWNPTKKGLE